MQLSFPLSFLLTTLLFALGQAQGALVKRQPGILTMPLKRLSKNTDVHPVVRLRQDINRSHRRHAWMSGREGRSTELAKRLETTDSYEYSKGSNHYGVTKPPVSTDGDLTTRGANGSSGGGFPDGVDLQRAEAGQGFPKADLDAANADSVTKAEKPTAPHSLGLDIFQNDVVYLATVQIGTPPRDFSIVMDSGSADFWVGGEICGSQGGGGCGNHTFLGNQSSTSFRNTGETWNITYGTGTVAGNIVTDNVNIAGMALDSHVFGVASVESIDFSNDTTKFDGIMGLGKSSLSTQGVLTPVESLAKQGLISEAITSYKFSRLSDGLNDGEITFGGLDESKFDPDTLVTFPDINTRGYWEANFTASICGEDLGLGNRSAILDTGTTLILAPAADAEAIHAEIPGAKIDEESGYYVVPCNTTTVVSLAFGGRDFDIDPIDLLAFPVDTNDLDGDCVSGILPLNTTLGSQTWIVGDVFLKNVYFSHNVGKNEISLAELV